MITLSDIQKRITEEIDIAHLPQEDQDRLVEELGGMLYQRMILSIFEKVPPSEHEKLKHLMESGLEDEITALIHKYVPNVGEVVLNELETSMKDYREALAQK